MRKIISIIIICMLLLTGLSIFPVMGMELNNNIKTSSLTKNFYIEEVTYDPDPPIKDDFIDIKVSIVAEGDVLDDPMLSVHLYVDDIIDPPVWIDMIVFDSPGTQDADLGYIFEDTEEHNIIIIIDPYDDYDETNEEDNTWSETMNAVYGFNFAIEKVTFEPNPPKKDELAIFNVTVAFENWDRGAVKVRGWIDGNTNGGMIGYVDPALGLYSTEIPILWPNDAEEHTVKLMVDPDVIWDETNEDDNTWEDSIKAKSKARSINNLIIKILDQFPILQQLFKQLI